MQEIELFLGLMVVMSALVLVARRLNLPYPIVLVLGGLVLGLLPGLPTVALDPDLVFLLILPPLLYLAAVYTSVRDFRANLRTIGLLAVGLVLFSTVAVAVVAHFAIAGLPWPAAFALGAIVAPPDAIAAVAVLQRLNVPRRIVTVLEGESLLNDATALVAYQVAVAAVVVGSFSPGAAGLRFLLVGIGGIAIGLGIGWLAVQVRRRLEDPPVEITIALLTPFAAYLPAEALGASGVIAAVTCGLYVGWWLPRITSSALRLQGRAVWEMVAFLLNGLVFILVGLQLRSIVAAVSQPPAVLLGYAALIALTVILARFAWVFPVTYLTRFLSARLGRGDPYPVWQNVFVVSWTGMRGVVSLAAALALPFTTAGGERFPRRELIIFLTFGVILATLVIQGLSLAPLIRLLGLAGDDGEEQEETQARLAAERAALARIEDLKAEWPAHLELLEQLEAQYRHRGQHTAERLNGAEEADQELIEHRLIRAAVLDAERGAVLELRYRGGLNDEVQRRIERELDLDELRMEA